MSSIWSSNAAQAGSGPFQTTGMAPTPGGMTAARVQSSGKSAAQPGIRPASASSVGATAPAASAADSGAGANGSTITSGDFLTLLVTEMQNQDPTAQTDPNEYINQLVGINSLEQLISMNQSLAAVLGAATTTTPSAPVPGVAGTAEIGMNTRANAAQGISATVGRTNTGVAKPPVQGNLSTPKAVPAAQVVGHALDGRNRIGGQGHAIRDIPTG